MKIFKIATFIAIAFLTLFSCKENSSTDSNTPNYAVIKGNIAKTVTDSISILANNKMVKRILHDDNGIFNDTIPLNTKQLFLFWAGESYTTLYLYPGAELDMDVKGPNFDVDIAFNEEYKPIYEYYRSKKVYGTDYYKFFGKWIERKEPDADDYRDLINRMEQYRNDLVQNLSEAKTVPSDFSDLEKRAIKYSSLIEFAQLDFELRMLNAKMPPYADTAEAEISNLPINENDFKIFPDYKLLVFSKYADEVRNEMDIDSTKSQLETAIKVFESVPNDRIKQWLIASEVESEISMIEDYKEAENLYLKYKKYITDTDLKKRIEDGFKARINLAEGQSSPLFKDYENFDGKRTSLEDFKGKYVYIDVWATWCVPCIAEIPHLKKLEEHYEGKDIEFVSISVDSNSDHEKWKKYVEKEQLTGTQLYATSSFDSSFIKAYGINAIPHFILIDPKGDIVASNASRPSSKDTRTVLDQLL